MNRRQQIAEGRVPVDEKKLKQNDLTRYMELAKKAHAQRDIDENKGAR